MNKQIDIGSLVSIVWTEGCTNAPAVVGIVTDITGPLREHGSKRQQIELFSNGKRFWYERGDLRLLA